MLERSLNNVVGKVIAQQLLHLRACNDEFFNQAALDVHIGDANALLHNIGAKLLLGQFDDAASETRTQRTSKVRDAEVKNVLHDIVSEWVLDERVCVLDDVRNQLGLLGTGSMINATLQNTASVAMGANHKTIVSNGFKDELGIHRLEVVEALLDDMVAIEVLDKSNNVLLKGALDCLDL